MNTFLTGLRAPIQKRGFNTSDLLARDSESFAELYNKSSTELNAILADKSRTQAEKSALINKASQKRVNELERNYKSMLNSHTTRAESLNAQRVAYSVSRDKAQSLELAKHLKEIKEPAKLNELVLSDQRYAEAINSMPSGYFNLKESTVDELTNRSIQANNPELYAGMVESGHDFEHIQKVQGFLEEAKKGYAQSIDNKALDTRFDDAQLAV